MNRKDTELTRINSRLVSDKVIEGLLLDIPKSIADRLLGYPDEAKKTAAVLFERMSLYQQGGYILRYPDFNASVRRPK